MSFNLSVTSQIPLKFQAFHIKVNKNPIKIYL